MQNSEILFLGALGCVNNLKDNIFCSDVMNKMVGVYPQQHIWQNVANVAADINIILVLQLILMVYLLVGVLVSIFNVETDVINVHI